MTKKRGPGRPVVYFGAVKTYAISLLRKTRNITHTRNILLAKKGDEWYEHRNLDVVPTPLKISVPTLRKWAEEKKIHFPLGRPAKAA